MKVGIVLVVKFVSDKEATENNGVCPDHQQSYQRLSEENYFFKASDFTEPLRQAIIRESNANNSRF